MTQKNSGKSVNFWVKFFLIPAAVALFFAGVALYGQFSKKRQVQTEINKLRNEAEKIEKENNLIREKIAYLESRDFREREAKDKLNLQNPDENLVIIKSRVPEIKQQEDEKMPEIPNPEKKIFNPRKWWDYFFKY